MDRQVEGGSQQAGEPIINAAGGGREEGRRKGGENKNKNGMTDGKIRRRGSPMEQRKDAKKEGGGRGKTQQ